jgi:hypothetical protein
MAKRRKGPADGKALNDFLLAIEELEHNTALSVADRNQYDRLMMRAFARMNSDQKSLVRHRLEEFRRKLQR